MFWDTVWWVGPGAVDMRSLQNRNLALKRKTKTQKKKKKMLHLAVQMTILPLAPEERRKISPKSPRNPGELVTTCTGHMLLDHTYKPWGLG